MKTSVRRSINRTIMNTRIINKLNMYKTVQSLCTANETIWSGVPAFVIANNELITKIQTLDQLLFAQSNGTLGVKTGKDIARQEAADLTHKIVSALRAFATATDNKVLEEQVHFMDSALYQGKHATALQYMRWVRDAAVQNVTVLADYGILQAEVDELVMRVDQLAVTIGNTRSAIVDRGKTTELINETVREIDVLLKKGLDLLVEVLKADHHEFALAYQKAREVVDLHGKKHKSGNEDTPAV